MTHSDRGDFAVNARLLRITGMAAVIGALATVGALVLLDLIRFFNNLFFFQTFSFANRSPAENTLGAWVILVPALVYLAITPAEAARGWGVVIGTDTAFMLGALALVGPRFSTQLRNFLLVFTVIDDIVAVSVIGSPA